MIETFIVPARIKKITFALMAIGVLGVILGFIVYRDEPTRVWANLLLCSYYSMGIALGATFLIAAHQIGLGGWHVMIRRIPEAFGVYIPVAGVALLIVVLAAAFSDHQLFHWMDPAVVDPKSPKYDAILAGKSGFLNIYFFLFRIFVYVALWSGVSYMLRNISRKEDEVGVQQTYKRSKYIAAAFIVVFAVTESTGSWDLIMSTNPHWYSTLFGWYNFASYTGAAVATIALVLGYVKGLGYLKRANEDHVHNLGMFMFGFSVFWAYLWFSQFMLIWYANIPEETKYFSVRLDQPLFAALFYINLIMNFFMPFFLLMTRKAKRDIKRVSFVAIIMLIGHYLDFYLMIMPNSVHHHIGLGWLEISIATGFVGLFLAVVLNGLTKASLVPVNNPYLKESIQHHTIK